MSPPRAQTRAARGYTLVEVMVALAILAVGVTGILSLENAAILANRHAQEVTLATSIARRWQERLVADAMQWNTPSQSSTVSDIGRDTQYLCMLVGCSGSSASPNAWFVPTPRSGGTDSAAFDAFGNEVPVTSSAARYCANVRLTWLRPDEAMRQGLVRAEVRVWWYREGGARSAAYAGCGTPAGLVALDNDVPNVHTIRTVATVTGVPQ